MLLPPTADPEPAPTVPVTIPLPRPLWEALQLCIPAGGDVTAVLGEAVEAYLAQLAAQEGEPSPLIATLARPIPTLDLSPRAERALLGAGIQYVYDLVRKTRRDIYPLKNFGFKSLREVERTIADLGLQLDMPLDPATYRAAVLQAHRVARHMGDREEA